MQLFWSVSGGKSWVFGTCHWQTSRHFVWRNLQSSQPGMVSNSSWMRRSWGTFGRFRNVWGSVTCVVVTWVIYSSCFDMMSLISVCIWFKTHFFTTVEWYRWPRVASFPTCQRSFYSNRTALGIWDKHIRPEWARHWAHFACAYWDTSHPSQIQVWSAILGPAWPETNSLVNCGQASSWHWMCRPYHPIFSDNEC